MALHIANLSSHVQVDELERVFRRFGTCNIQVKGKYGFVYYDYPASAERALKTLKGARVCGEAITMSWAKFQPRAPPGGGSRLYKPPSRRYYSVKENPHGNSTSNPWHHGMDLKKPHGEVRRLNSSIMIDGPISYEPYGSNLHERKNERIHVNRVESGRWGEAEQLVGPTNGENMDTGLEFDRYEPRISESRSEFDGRECVSFSSRSPSEKDSFGGLDSIKGLKNKKRNLRHHESSNVICPAKGPSSSPIHSAYTSSRSPSFHYGTKTPKTWSASRSISPLVSERQKDSVANAVSQGHNNDSSEKEAGRVRAENITSAVEDEIETRLVKLEEENVKKGPHGNNDEHGESVSRGSCDLLDSDVSKSDGDSRIVDNFSLHCVEKIPNSQNNDFVGSRPLALESDVISARSHNRGCARMSFKEMCMVLKHYGLQYPDEKEKDLSVETYFGSACLWPWEMIFYRRFKRGPISPGNYSRRLAQNEEFSIVDKYIRSSSGWEEMN